jgi:hypothetical protein
MKKGINLALTKSLYDFKLLLERVIETLPSERRSIETDLSELFNIFCFDKRPSEYKIGKEVTIYNENIKKDYNETESSGRPFSIEKMHSMTSSSYKFWIVYGWEENEKRESCLWLEFVRRSCQAYRGKLDNLIGTSGKYYREVVSKFTHAPKTDAVFFYMKDKYLKQFYNENISLSVQEEILTGFINEVLDKL